MIGLDTMLKEMGEDFRCCDFNALPDARDWKGYVIHPHTGKAKWFYGETAEEAIREAYFCWSDKNGEKSND